MRTGSMLRSLFFSGLVTLPCSLFAQGSENAIAAGFIIALVSAGLVVFLFVMPVVYLLLKTHDSRPPFSRVLGISLLTLVVCLVVGAMAAFIMMG